MMRAARRPVVLFAQAMLLVVAALSARGDQVKFNRDIRPIMSDTCFHCHGPDAKSRKANLRLDIREEALKPAKSGEIPIVPGKPDESEIIKRIFTKDEDDLMPPEEAHKELTSAQKETFRQWVAEGAVYEAHWAYTPLAKPAVPKIQNPKSKVQNPIDAFILEKLAAKNVQPSSEADKRTLLRRLSLDITGLPPTPGEVNAFLADKSSKAYERQVDRLLKSPHYGERLAAWWLDVARFADTVGYHGDQNQRIFPYRDYVINAFNQNKPFNQFTVEQLAGDLLPNPTAEQLVATGFNRLNMMTREGGAQPKEYLAKYGADRVRTVATAWLGATFGCAECHDHKFDPISQRDFYSLQSFFADVKQWGVYAEYTYTPNPELRNWSNDHPFPPEIETESQYLHLRQARFELDLKQHFAGLSTKLNGDAKARASFDEWAAAGRIYLQVHPDGWDTPQPVPETMKDGKALPNTNAVVDAERVVDFPGKAKKKGEEHRVSLPLEPGRLAAIRMEALPGERDEDALGNGQQRQGIKLTATLKPKQGKERKLAVYHADADFKEPRYSGTEELIGVAGGWKLSAKNGREKQTSVWLLDPPVAVAEGDKLQITLGGDPVTRARFATSPFAAEDPLRVADESFRKALLAKKQTKEQRTILENTYLLSTTWDAEGFAQFKKLNQEILQCRDGRAWSMVTVAMKPLTIRVLPRGNWQDESGVVVLPTTPHFVPGVASTEQKRLSRLDLARWMCAPENPLTARNVMNRLWKQFFGNAISGVVDDLGAQGEPPSHPELLNWLASEFRDSGWNVKHAIKLMVMSSTYRQSSSLRPELKDIDPNNRLLASQNPRRLDAEFVRDNALFVAGKLNVDDIGGPSVKPYQPAGYYANIQFPNRDYAASTDERQYRRGVYMHWQRTFLHPMLANFDAPGREECTANRVVSNTPQQALTLLNDPTFVESSRLFAERLLNSKATSDDERIMLAYQFALAREPKSLERESLKKLLVDQRAYYVANTEDAAKFVQIGLSKPDRKLETPELAAWTSVCRVVLNLHETITRY